MILTIQDLTLSLRDPEAVFAIATDLANVNPAPFSSLQGTTWNDLSLTNGYPSLVLLFATLAKQGLIEDADAVVHKYVLKVKEAIETEGLFHLSLFGGAAGICFALKEASCEGTRYQKMLGNLHTFLFDHIERIYFEPLLQNLKQNIPISPTLYDPIQGVCGVGRYALENLHDPQFEAMAKKTAQILVSLSQPFSYKERSVPGWFLSPNDMLNMRHRSICPNGTFNLGLAHGVTGILAFLAIAWLRGIQIEGQKEAMLRIANWIQSKAILTNGAYLWPYHISWEEEMDGAIPVMNGSKDAWCYGVPGIARTLFLTGKALGNKELMTFAEVAYRGIFLRGQTEWNIPGPTICHGIAGLALITFEMSKETGCEDLISEVDRLKQTLLSFYNPDAPWGFRDIEACRQGKSCELDKPGFLEGTAGVLLTLASLSSPPLNWHLPLMIHG